MERSEETGLLLPGGAFGRRQFLRGIAATGAVAGAGGLLTACSSSSGSTKTGGASVAAAAPKRGGNLQIGLTGGSNFDTIDPHMGVTYTDTSRLQSLYDPLVQLDANANIQYVLAEENGINPYKGSISAWTIKLRSGVTFHDGKPLTSDDVVYTFQRILTGTGKAPFSGAIGLGPVNAKGIKALDKLTVLVPMTSPFATFVDQMATFWYYMYVAPRGFNVKKPVGTGPFMYQSFTPGVRSVFVRNPHYWQTGKPYVDKLTIVDFSDSTSLQDALVTGVIQGAGTLNGSQIPALSTTAGIKAVVSKAGGMTPFTMRVDAAPFSDVNVRQALRLLVDRQQFIDSALNGYGTVASDVFSPFDPDFDPALRRETDIPQAKFLLKQAGKSDLHVQLTTSGIATGTIQMATVLAEQAKAAGVTIKLNSVQAGTFFGSDYLQWPFAQDYYNYSPYLAQVAYSMLPTSPFNETHEKDPGYIALYNQANAEADSIKRKAIEWEMQKFDFTQGGYIIPAYIDTLDAYSAKITGYVPARVGQPLSNFTFANFSFV